MRYLAIILMLWAGWVQAAPHTQTTDDIKNFLQDKGVIAQINQLKQNVGQQASELILSAMGFLGVPYKRGGSNENGFDCSGFVRSMYEQTVGLVLPQANLQSCRHLYWQQSIYPFAKARWRSKS